MSDADLSLHHEKGARLSRGTSIAQRLALSINRFPVISVHGKKINCVGLRHASVQAWLSFTSISEHLSVIVDYHGLQKADPIERFHQRFYITRMVTDTMTDSDVLDINI